jgi:hypothetical protein
MHGLRVLYFTCVPLGVTTNGGSLVCREHAGRIGAAPGVTLTVCTTGPGAQAAGDAAFAASIGARAVFLPWQDAAPAPRSRWPFLLEASAAAQPHVDAEFVALLADQRPDLLAVDYLPAALFIRRAYQTRTRRLTITLNREARFFRDLRRHGLVPADASATLAAELRLAAFEHWVHARSHAVVALARGDLPR